MEILYIPLKKVSSTQTYAHLHKKTFDPNGFTVVTAEEQTQARGTFQKKWYSPPKNLSATMYFQVSKTGLHPYLFTQMLAISVVEFFVKRGVNMQIKWPNDLFLSGKKCGGILGEVVEKGVFWEVFMGIGLNIKMGEKECAKIDQPATSLEIATKKIWSVEEILEEIVPPIRDSLMNLETFSPKTLQKTFQKHLLYLHKELLIEKENAIEEGIFLGTDLDGALILQTKECTKKIYSGKIKQKPQRV